MSDWFKYPEIRPTKAGLYWWRVPAKDYGGITLRPEWVGEYRGSLCQPQNLNPDFSHWDGYAHRIPDGVEWSHISKGDEDGDIVWPGFKAKPCPFCGNQPRIKWASMWATGKVFQNPEYLSLECCIVSVDYRDDLKRALEKWNERQPPKESPDGKAD